MITAIRLQGQQADQELRVTQVIPSKKGPSHQGRVNTVALTACLVSCNCVMQQISSVLATPDAAALNVFSQALVQGLSYHGDLVFAVGGLGKALKAAGLHHRLAESHHGVGNLDLNVCRRKTVPQDTAQYHKVGHTASRLHHDTWLTNRLT